MSSKRILKDLLKRSAIKKLKINLFLFFDTKRNFEMSTFSFLVAAPRNLLIGHWCRRSMAFFWRWGFEPVMDVNMSDFIPILHFRTPLVYLYRMGPQ
ncbi:hypothetical protein GDO78_002422 [Eleutherodactylus coqui]|uniref:Uncharacterized protein n=1 Tax=Eleutherodactylus coqui TaxID=57060 RepID=A0A8J6K2L6_ELECQ|nr:hypothetical protein GDO78_002422 [Eleutherodactylus coqui]